VISVILISKKRKGDQEIRIKSISKGNKGRQCVAQDKRPEKDPSTKKRQDINCELDERKDRFLNQKKRGII